MPGPLTLPVRYGRTKPPPGVPVRRGNPLAPAPGGLWPLNEGAGSTVYDASGNRHTGSFIDSPLCSWTHGALGRAVHFPGGTSAGDIRVSSTGILNGGGADCSVFGWVQMTTVGSFAMGGCPTYCERSSDGTDIFKLDGTDGTSPNSPFFTFRDDAGNLTQIRSSKTMNDGKLHMIGFTVKGTICQMYFDGLPDVSGTVNAWNAFTHSGVESRIGGDNNDTTARFNGSIACVLVRKGRALLPAEVRRLYVAPFQMF